VGKPAPVHTGANVSKCAMWEALADGLLDAAILARLEQTFARAAPTHSAARSLDRSAK
jgi:hypothetical protein